MLAGTAAVYASSLWNGFVNVDDQFLVTENVHVLVPAFSNVWYVLTHFDPELYIPVTFFSYQIETWIFGPHAWHFHLINLLLHLGSTLLAWSIVTKLTKSDVVGGITAALFALHPLNAEAVLWVSARKDILSALFFLASLHQYLRHDETNDKRSYARSIIFFVLALGSKVTAFTLPVVLLLIEFAKRSGRTTSAKKLWPFFACSIVFGCIALVGKSAVTQTIEAGPMIIMALRSTLFYLQLVIAPAGQAVMHAVPKTMLFSPLVLLAILTLLGLTLWLWKAKKVVPAAWWGWLFFCVTLTPTFLHYTRGNEFYLLASERYAYLPSIGIFLIVATTWTKLFSHPQVRASTRTILVIGSSCVLAVLGFLTILRTFVFRDSVMLHMDTLQKHPDDSRAAYGLAMALQADKRPMQAEIAYEAALKMKPDYVDVAIDLGILLLGEGRQEEGLAMLERASMMRDDSFKAHYNVGVAYQNISRWSDAAAAYEKSIALFPDFADAHKNLATVYGKMGKMKEAVRELEILGTLDPEIAKALSEAKKKL